MDEYVTVAGIVQFPPRFREANGKQVRDVAIRAIGSNKRVNVTIWPDKADVPVNKGDFIIADGKYSQSPGQDKRGETITYYNVSASVLMRFAGESEGTISAPTPKKVEAEDETTGDDFPF